MNKEEIINQLTEELKDLFDIVDQIVYVDLDGHQEIKKKEIKQEK
jgi:hypothetical protein